MFKETDRWPKEMQSLIRRTLVHLRSFDFLRVGDRVPAAIKAWSDGPCTTLAPADCAPCLHKACKLLGRRAPCMAPLGRSRATDGLTLACMRSDLALWGSCFWICSNVLQRLDAGGGNGRTCIRLSL